MTLMTLMTLIPLMIDWMRRRDIIYTPKKNKICFSEYVFIWKHFVYHIFETPNANKNSYQNGLQSVFSEI